MKQLPLTDELKARLKAVAPDVDAEKISIFVAAALSTAPVRKKHPIYNGAVHTTNFLAQMMAEVKKESRPLQIMQRMVRLSLMFGYPGPASAKATEVQSKFIVSDMYAHAARGMKARTLS